MVDNLLVRAVLTGLLFGIWPLLMNKSGLNGNVSSLVLVVGMLAFVLPFSVSGIGTIFSANTKLMFAIMAAVLGAAGILLFNGILAKTTPQTVSLVFVSMLVTQILVPFAYHLIVTGGITATKGAGFALAIAAAILLNI